MELFKKFILMFLVLLLWGCEKFLEEKVDKQLVVPSSLRDLQSLIDNFSNINSSDPLAGELAADDYYLLYDVWVSRSEHDQRGYIWEPEYSTTHNSWFPTYRIIYYANIILGSIEAIERTPANQRDWDNVKGQAYFLRAKSFLHIAGIWSLAYDKSTANSNLGIPLRLTDDFNIPSTRANVEDTYSQIVSDLERAVELLPTHPDHLLRASKPAAMALLARTYLFMRDYENCFVYANACLELKGELMDYNDLDPAPAYPIPLFNTEILYYSVAAPASNPTLNVNNALVDTLLLQAYSEGDLRKLLFFRTNTNGTVGMRGNYSGNASRFTGMAIDEVYLMRAECYAKQKNVDAAMGDLNHLRSHYFTNDTPYIPLIAASAEDAVEQIRLERRKQLLFRGLRFPDVKRQNMEGANIGFKRVLNNTEYSISANDLRFALTIPETIIERAPTITPNPR